MSSDYDDYYDEYYIPIARAPMHKTCKHCGTKNLVWKQTEHGWRLASTEGVVHECPVVPRPEKSDETPRSVGSMLFCPAPSVSGTGGMRGDTKRDNGRKQAKSNR